MQRLMRIALAAAFLGAPATSFAKGDAAKAPPVAKDKKITNEDLPSDEDDAAAGDGTTPGKPVDKRQRGGGGGGGGGMGEVVVAHQEGEYGGVVPGKDGHAQAKKGKKRPSTPTISWVGFQQLDAGSARVFAQFTAAASPTFTQSVVGDELVVDIPSVTLNLRNNARPLDTKYFDTRIARVEAKRVGAGGRGKTRHAAGVELHIKFKQGTPAQADGKIETGADGNTYLYLDFAP